MTNLNARKTPRFTELPPLSLYIHIPWCVKKCPYCDFNSHKAEDELPIRAYVAALDEDLRQDADWAQGRRIESIFFGGGTPSLLPNDAINEILSNVDTVVGILPNAEITLEANPGTVEHHDFSELRAAGINRLSMGVQSFDSDRLAALGRIHSGTDATNAYKRAREGGFDNINLDLMHGLPGQSIEGALKDLETAIALAPEHLSWYQLTIEPNTEFFSRPPRLPEEAIMQEIYEQGITMLASAGYRQYEISAYARHDKEARHNLNYWQFGDYLAIGAGAHGKITRGESGEIVRFQKTRLPRDYLAPSKAYTAKSDVVGESNLPLEFMMNALRLREGVDAIMFQQRTGLPLDILDKPLQQLRDKGLICNQTDRLATTALGRNFLNTVLEAFL